MKITYERVHPETQTVTIESANPEDFVDRQAVAGFLRDDRGRILVIETANRRLLEVPGGAIDPGETAEVALAREFQEETGLDVEVGEYICEGVSYFAWQNRKPCRSFRRYYRVRLLGGTLLVKGDGKESFGAHWMFPHELNESNTLAYILEVIPQYITFLHKRGV